MIKKDGRGKVVEFEDEAGLAAKDNPQRTKDLKAVTPLDGTALTPEQAKAEYEAALAAVEEAAKVALKEIMDELGAEVARLDVINKSEKKGAKDALRFSFEEAERIRREKASQAEQTYQQKLDAIWSRYRVAIEPINAKLEAGKITIEAARQKDRDAALTAYKERLAVINKAKEAEAKVKAVAAESLPAGIL